MLKIVCLYLPIALNAGVDLMGVVGGTAGVVGGTVGVVGGTAGEVGGTAGAVAGTAGGGEGPVSVVEDHGGVGDVGM